MAEKFTFQQTGNQMQTDFDVIERLIKPFLSTKLYTRDDLVIYNHKIWRCISESVGPSVWTGDGDWEEVDLESLIKPLKEEIESKRPNVYIVSDVKHINDEILDQLEQGDIVYAGPDSETYIVNYCLGEPYSVSNEISLITVTADEIIIYWYLKDIETGWSIKDVDGSVFDIIKAQGLQEHVELDRDGYYKTNYGIYANGGFHVDLGDYEYYFGDDGLWFSEASISETPVDQDKRAIYSPDGFASSVFYLYDAPIGNYVTIEMYDDEFCVGGDVIFDRNSGTITQPLSASAAKASVPELEKITYDCQYQEEIFHNIDWAEVDYINFFDDHGDKDIHIENNAIKTFIVTGYEQTLSYCRYNVSYNPSTHTAIFELTVTGQTQFELRIFYQYGIGYVLIQ